MAHPIQSPPDYIVSAVERFVPGFWGSWVRAINWAHFDSAPWHVTSWHRSRALNQSVGGHPFSQHLLGTSFDLRHGPRIADSLRRVGFVVIDERTHLHAQPWPAGSASALMREIGAA